MLSNQGAVGKSGISYSNDVSLQTLAHHLREEVQRRFEARDPHWRYQIRSGPDPVNALLCERLHLAPFRFGPDKRWPDGQPFANHAIFLLDTSLSEHPDRFGVSMKLLKQILAADTDIKQFNVLAFNAGAAWAFPKNWMANTNEGREQMLARLDGMHLEGATDLSAALAKLKDGLVEGLQPDRRLTADEAIVVARETLEAVEDSGN